MWTLHVGVASRTVLSSFSQKNQENQLFLFLSLPGAAEGELPKDLFREQHREVGMLRLQSWNSSWWQWHFHGFRELRLGWVPEPPLPAGERPGQEKKSFSSYFNFQREKFLRQEQDPGWGMLRLVLGIRECLRSSVLPCKFQGLTIKNPIIAVAGVVLIPAAHPKHPWLLYNQEFCFSFHREWSQQGQSLQDSLSKDWAGKTPPKIPRFGIGPGLSTKDSSGEQENDPSRIRALRRLRGLLPKDSAS